MHTKSIATPLTTPVQISSAVSYLDGILSGIAADHHIHPREIAALENWLRDNKPLGTKLQFRELYHMLSAALADNILSMTELENIKWLCKRCILNPSDTQSRLTQDLEFLHGLISGISSDGLILQSELDALKSWLDGAAHLQSQWPYDELYSLLSHTVNEERIDPDSKGLAIKYFKEFLNAKGSIDPMLIEQEYLLPITAICSVCPEILFEGGLFSIAGKSSKASREQITRQILGLGGLVTDSVSPHLNYLVVCAGDNPNWTYAAYGREVENALNLRKSGARIMIVHEYDFWDAVQDAA